MLPVRSEGTRYFLLSKSGTLALGAFSTITWKETERKQETNHEYHKTKWSKKHQWIRVLPSDGASRPLGIYLICNKYITLKNR